MPDAEEDDRPAQGSPWPQIYAHFAEKHHWTKSVVDGLTLYAVHIYLGAIDIRGRHRVSVQTAMRIAERKRQLQ